MCKLIHLVNGPEKHLAKAINEIKKEDIISLSQFLETLRRGKDQSKSKDDEKDLSVGNVLLCRSEEFATLNDGYVDALPVFLKTFIHSRLFSKVIFHNAPTNVVKMIKNLFSKEEVEEFRFRYQTLNFNHLTRIKETYHDVIIGQPDVLKRLLVHLYPLTKKKYKKPIILLLYGPAGVGKTETAKFLGSILAKSHSIFRTQLSMHQTSDFASYLFGDNIHKSSLALDLLNRESNVLLFDEFDKCPPVLYSAFYQMFDEGIFIDKNYNVNLENSIILCTSNFRSEKEILTQLGEAIYSRFDGFIQYRDLEDIDKEKIVQREYETIYEQMLDIDERAIIDNYQTLHGLKQEVSRMTNVRNIKHYVQMRISDKIISHKLGI